MTRKQTMLERAEVDGYATVWRGSGRPALTTWFERCTADDRPYAYLLFTASRPAVRLELDLIGQSFRMRWTMADAARLWDALEGYGRRRLTLVCGSTYLTIDGIERQHAHTVARQMAEDQRAKERRQERERRLRARYGIATK